MVEEGELKQWTNFILIIFHAGIVRGKLSYGTFPIQSSEREELELEKLYDKK